MMGKAGEEKVKAAHRVERMSPSKCKGKWAPGVGKKVHRYWEGRGMGRVVGEGR